MSDLAAFEIAALEAAMRHMFREGGFLSICDIDKMLRVVKVVPPKREYDAIAVMHCVSWRDMKPELRDESVRIILSWFQLPAFDPFATLQLRNEKVGFFRKLIGSAPSGRPA